MMESVVEGQDKIDEILSEREAALAETKRAKEELEREKEDLIRGKEELEEESQACLQGLREKLG